MTSRRTFVKSAALFSAVTLVSPTLLAASPTYIGLQLFTLRADMQRDPAGTLAKVAQAGYTSVEGATYTGSQQFYGLRPAAFKQLLRQNKLAIPSSHYMLGEQQTNGQPTLGTILHNWDKAVDDAATVGIQHMVLAYLFEGERGNLDHYKLLAERLNKAGERCKKAGIQLCYHNHDFEFAAQDGQLPYDILLTQTDQQLVKMELDLYWAIKAGHDPIDLFKAHPGRFPLWHVKDIAKTAPYGYTEVGNGSIDFKKIFAQQKLAGLKYFFVEQDETPGSPYASIEQSIVYIKRNLL
jgi:sugar phosphate isomerase/epimerase